MAWFKKARRPISAPAARTKVPEGMWVKCPGCARILYKTELAETLRVCSKCSYHFRMTAAERLASLLDQGTWTEHDVLLESTDPLAFTDTKPYRERLVASRAATGLRDAVMCAQGRLDGIEVSIVAMEYGFIGGSMGVVVGEKITRAVERALEERLPLLIVCCSGGARMMEGALSLMQMAKISAALARLDRAALPYIAILHGPHDRGGDSQLRDACRPQHRRAAGADRVCGAACHRANDPAEAAGRVSAERVSSGARHARPCGRPA